MHVKIIQGESTDKIRKACYDFLYRKYLKEKEVNNIQDKKEEDNHDRHIRSSVDR